MRRLTIELPDHVTTGDVVRALRTAAGKLRRDERYWAGMADAADAENDVETRRMANAKSATLNADASTVTTLSDAVEASERRH